MRLVRTQARETKKILKKAEALILKAVETRNYFNLQINLEKILGAMPGAAQKLVLELAKYEAQFTAKLLKVKPVPALKLKDTAETVKVAVSLNREPDTIVNTYKKFAVAVTTRSLQNVFDKQIIMTPEPEVVQSIKEQYNGMFTTQNLALAGVAVIGMANAARGLVATENDYQLEWSAILDESTCDDCEAEDGNIYDSWDENEIPAHANCRCTWIVIENNANNEEA